MRRALERVPGVTVLEVEVGTAVVEAEPTVTRDAIASALDAEVYRLKG